MAIVRIECDQRFLKAHSEIERVLHEHGRLDARTLANLAVDHEPIFVEIDDIVQAKDLAESLNGIMDVKATVESSEGRT